jgi:hypothetical protein
MKDAMLAQVTELLRETFDGGLPDQGTIYLDHTSGIRNTLSPLTAEQASRRLDGHPSIAAHARHMNFHLRTIGEWMEGDRSPRDWPGSFEPQTVTAEEWAKIQRDLEASRARLLRVLGTLPPEQFIEVGAGIGAVVHLAYHLGAIRQLLHRVT